MLIDTLITKEVYHNGDYYVFACVSDSTEVQLNKYGNFSIAGNLGYLSVGHRYKLELVAEESKYGITYKVTDCPSLSNLDYNNLTKEQTLELLMSATTKALAEEISNKYPNCVSLIMQNKEDEIDVTKLHNIKKTRLAQISKNVRDKFKFYEIYVAFRNYDFTTSECKTLSNHFGEVEIIRKALEENPYNVCIDILDKSFHSADLTIISINDKWRDSDIRAEYLILDILNENEINGSTRMNVIDMASEFNETAPNMVHKLPTLVANLESVYYDATKKLIAKRSTYLKEMKIAENLLKRVSIHPTHIEANIEEYRHQSEGDLTDEQISALQNICTENVSILCGAGGVGKSFTVNSIIKLLDNQNLTYTLLTPTGTSAKVLSNYTNRKAYTIHKQLMGEQGVFTDFLIVDEFSFVGVDLMAMLLESTDIHTRILFVADEYQLGSISCGNVLKNMIDSNQFKLTRLTKVFRYGKGGISTIATDIRNGISLNMRDYDKYDDYHFYPLTENPLEQILKCYDYLLTKYDYHDIIILSPFNVRTCGTNEINAEIQRSYNSNPTLLKVGKDIYKVNDPVINTKNWYGVLIYTNEDIVEADDIDVMNGEIGTVVDIIDNTVLCKFENNIVAFTQEHLSHLKLAYAMSTHKSQGHQYKAVINIFGTLHKGFINRGLLYVASSRAQKELCQISTEEILNYGVNNLEISKRDTYLYDFLIGKEAITNVYL